MTTSKSVFIVDDDFTYTYLTSRTITSTRIPVAVTTFDNGQIAIDFLKKIIDTPELWPDVILLDLHMPLLDGWQFLEEYGVLPRRNDIQTALYIVSSSISPDDRERAARISPVSGFLTKPLSKAKITEIIEKIPSVNQIYRFLN